MSLPALSGAGRSVSTCLQGVLHLALGSPVESAAVHEARAGLKDQWKGEAFKHGRARVGDVTSLLLPLDQSWVCRIVGQPGGMREKMSTCSSVYVRSAIRSLHG